MKRFFCIVAAFIAVSASGQSVVLLPPGASGLAAIDSVALGATNIIAGATDAYNPATKTLTWNTNKSAQIAAVVTEADPVFTYWLATTYLSREYTPSVVSSSVSGTWTIDLTKPFAQIYTQTGDITNVVFVVNSTNSLVYADVMMLASTNSLIWPTNNLFWPQGGLGPFFEANKYNVLLFRGHRGRYSGVYKEAYE